MLLTLNLTVDRFHPVLRDYPFTFYLRQLSAGAKSLQAEPRFLRERGRAAMELAYPKTNVK